MNAETNNLITYPGFGYLLKVILKKRFKIANASLKYIPGKITYCHPLNFPSIVRFLK